jgi:hypothetical protein
MLLLIAPRRISLTPPSLWRDAEIEDFLEGFNQPTYRGMGCGCRPWSSKRGMRGL